MRYQFLNFKKRKIQDQQIQWGFRPCASLFKVEDHCFEDFLYAARIRSIYAIYKNMDKPIPTLKGSYATFAIALSNPNRILCQQNRHKVDSHHAYWAEKGM